jgi:hypothetical protein
MIRSLLRPALCAALLASPLLAAEFDPSRLPATARWLVHADVAAIRNSQTGKAVFRQIEAEHGDKLRAIKRMFSLHLAEDLQGVTLYGDGKNNHAVASIHGRFDREHLEDIVRGADGYVSTAHGNHTIHTWTDKGVVQHAAFAENDVLVFSRQMPLLTTALDAWTKTGPVTEDPLFTDAAGQHFVVAGRIPDLEMPADAARMLKMAETLRMTATEADGRFVMRLELGTRRAEDANRFRRFLDGLVAFGQMMDPQLSDMDLAIELQAGKDGMSANFSLPLVQWLFWLKQEADKRKAS